MFATWLLIVAAVHLFFSLAILVGLSQGRLRDEDGSQLGARVLFILFAATAASLAMAGLSLLPS